MDGWIKFNGTPGLATLINKINYAGAPNGFGLVTVNGVLSLALGTGTGSPAFWVGTKNIAADKAWHHVAVIVSRSAGVTFVVDGMIDPLTQNPSMIPSTVTFSNAEPLLLSGADTTLDEIESTVR